MGKKSKPQKVPAIDPQKLIAQNELMNHVNISNPFGSQTYVTGADGRQTLTTALSPEMQALFNTQMSRASAPASHYDLPSGQAQLLATLLAKTNARYSGS